MNKLSSIMLEYVICLIKSTVPVPDGSKSDTFWRKIDPNSVHFSVKIGQTLKATKVSVFWHRDCKNITV